MAVVWTTEACTSPAPATPLRADELVALPSDGLARGCLRLTSPGLRLARLRDDAAAAHFDSVHAALRPWSQEAHGYHRHAPDPHFRGRMIENEWIQVFGRRWAAHRATGGRLRDIFGEFVPLFVPWVDVFVAARFKKNRAATCSPVLLLSILYIT